MQDVLITNGLSKSYGSVVALSGLSINVPSGSTYGILGPNGSGKTTTLGILLNVINKSEGKFSWFDNGETDHNRKRIGAILETPNFYHYLSGRENLKVAARIKGVQTERIDEVLDVVGLSNRARSSFKAYSLGMKQRLSIASALLNDPDVLVLDEPTNGLDPEGIAEVRLMIQNIANQGKTIILASHLLDEVEKICDHVVVLKNGKALAQGKVSSILTQSDRIEIGVENMGIARESLLKYPIQFNIKEDHGFLQLSTDSKVDIGELNAFMVKEGVKVNHLRKVKRSLEDQYLELVK